MNVTCPQCRRELPASVSRCGYCGASAGAEAAVAKPALDPVALRLEVRARIFWGDDPQKVRAEFLKQGVSMRDLDRSIQEAVQERREHFKQKGRLDVLKGGGFGLLFLMALGVWYLISHPETGPTASSPQNTGMIFVGLLAFPGAAFFFIHRGLRRIKTGGIGERDVSDLEEED